MRTLHRTELRKILELTTGSPAVLEDLGRWPAEMERKTFQNQSFANGTCETSLFQNLLNMIGMQMYKPYMMI